MKEGGGHDKEVASSKLKNEYAKIDTLFMTKMAAKWPKSIPYLWPKRLKNLTLWGRTYLYSPYKGVPPPPGSWLGFLFLLLVAINKIIVETNNCSFDIFWAVFTRVSKSNWFCVITLHDWLEKFLPLFDLIRSKPKPIVTRSHTFSRALYQLQVFNMSQFDRFIGGIVCFLGDWWLAKCNRFGYSFTTLNWNPL